MKQIRILLICGSGASSGFLATNMRKAAKNRGLDVVVMARSEAEIENYVNDIDCLLVGPHLAYLLEDVKRIIQNRNIKVALIEKENYARLDGEKTLDHVLTLFN